MEYKNIKPKRVWTVLLIILLAVLAALTCFVSVKPAGVYVEWARYGVYATGVGLEGIVPAGSIIITDRTVAVSDYSVAAAFVKNGDVNYPADTESALFGILRIEDGKYTISNGDNTVDINKQQAEQKQSLKEKREAAQKAKAVKAAKAGTSTTEAGRVGDRPYARGRAYKADRYDD